LILILLLVANLVLRSPCRFH